MRPYLGLLSVFVAGCGPQLIDEVGATGTTADASGTIDEITTDAPPEPDTTTLAPDPIDSTTDAPEPGTDTGDTGDAPVVACPDGQYDPFDFTPYRTCQGGIAEIVAVQPISGPTAFHAYAQFYTVLTEAQIVWEETIHDPFEGPGDCAVRTFGNAGEGVSESIVWEDAGDLTFLGPNFTLPAHKYGDPQSVLGYEGELFDLGIEPSWGANHGLVTTGATVPALDLPTAVRLPDRIEVQAPALDGGTLDHADAVFTWTPSPLGLSTWLSLAFSVTGGTLQIVCDMGDSGEFTVPPGLFDLAPLPATARLYLHRSDIRSFPIDADRVLRYEGHVAAEGKLQVE